MDIINSPEAKLTVFKASAGSGKTFRLTVEYIKLLIEDPLSYRNILAVTFTNKATGEMKERILSTLYGLSKGLKSSKRYMDRLIDETVMQRSLIMQKSQLALLNLLHEYHYFQIQTIDKFFQRVFRNLSRELNLNSNLRIDIREKEIMQLAVDELMENIESKDEEFKWIWDYVSSRMDDNKTWTFLSDLKSFGTNIFKDFYKSNSNEIHKCFKDPKFFDSYKQRLTNRKKVLIDEMKAYGERFFEIIEKEGFVKEDFYNGNRGIFNYFVKLKNGSISNNMFNTYVKPCCISSEKWISAKSRRKSELKTIVDRSLIDMLNEIEKRRPSYYKTCLSIDITLQHIEYLRLLGSIEEKVKEMNSDDNRFMLSDTQLMLQQLIGESDTPFIYEKIGSRLNHIMIDEFQDTSQIQWKNFQILLKECMDKGYSNLIVGDVKQSIYRWRDGDWGLLAGIKDLFDKDMVVEKSLDTNYRSRKKIVTFNNHFFTKASAITSNEANALCQITDAYSDTWQKVDEDKSDDGYVEIKLFNYDDDSEIYQWLDNKISLLISNGIPQGDIGILTRSNQELSEIARYFQTTRPDLRMVSNEAFLLDFSISVNTIIDAMRLLVNSKDNLTLYTLAKNYHCNVLKEEKSDTELFTNQTDMWLLLPEEMRNETSRNLLSSLPVNELAEQLYRIFSLNKLPEQDAYVCSFLDLLSDHLHSNISTLDDFLRNWDDELHKKTIQCDAPDAIRLLTIHKSKGLEIKNLLIPFCDWDLEKNNAVVWFKPEDEEFEALPVVPVRYKKALADSIYSSQYAQEHMQNLVDNLNLLYVAFTRAVDRLYVSGSIGGDNNRSQIIVKAIDEIINDNEFDNCVYENNPKETFFFSYGDELIMSEEKKSESDKEKNVFLKTPSTLYFELDAYKEVAHFRQSGKSDKFVSGEDFENENEYIKIGNLLHNVLSRIKTVEDINPELERLAQEGILNTDIESKKLCNMLRKRLKTKPAADWFDNHWTVHNECCIIDNTSKESRYKELRPDRVISDNSRMLVIDYKFGKPKEDHKIQVRRYIDVLKRMGYANVEGYLWYVYDNIVEIVKKP